MEATEIINPNGSIERTITLNPEESQAALENLSPEIRATVEERLGQSIASLPPAMQMSAEELERICDEAVGIYSTESTSAIAVSDISTNEVTLDSRNQDIVVDFTQRVNSWDDAEIIDPTADDPDDEEENVILDEIEPEVPEPTEQASLTLADLNTSFTADNHSRFSSAEWFDNISEAGVLIGGAGGISSWLAMLLSRTNIHSMFLFDSDTVETANLSGQFFGMSDVGCYKVDAVSRRIREMSDFYRCEYRKELYTRDCAAWDIMMCGFDNMAARKIFFDNWKTYTTSNLSPSHCLFLDGRLSAETLQVYCIQGDDTQAMDEYQQNCLFSDDEADHTVCSYKQTSFMANIIAGTMVNLFVNWCANRAGGFRPVPFFTEYDAVTMQYKIKMSAV